MFGFGKKKDRNIEDREQAKHLVESVVENALPLMDEGLVRSAELREGIGYIDYGFFRAEYRDTGEKLEATYMFESEPPMKGSDIDEAVAKAYPDERWCTYEKDDDDPTVRISTEYETESLDTDDIPDFVREEGPYMTDFRHACKDMGFELN